MADIFDEWNDFYEILNSFHDETVDNLKKRYHDIMRINHPDKLKEGDNRVDAEAKTKVRTINFIISFY